MNVNTIDILALVGKTPKEEKTPPRNGPSQLVLWF
jgi:hypothetical protein